MAFDKTKLKEALTELKKSKKRNFSQTYDLIINLKNLDLKKNEQQIDYYTSLTHKKVKKTRVCALVGTELIDQAKDVFDTTIHQDDFQKYADNPRLAKKLAREHDFFVAQANIMPAVAKAFGKALGTRKKMPNPKAGCVVPPKFNLKPLYEKLQNTVRIYAKENPLIQVVVGDESMSDDDVIANLNGIYENILHHLPGEKNNIRSAYVKLTMSKPVKLE